jgi:hypothetical protein
MENGDEPADLVDHFLDWLGRYGRVSPTNLRMFGCSRFRSGRPIEPSFMWIPAY